jgi:hypothetical protein
VDIHEYLPVKPGVASLVALLLLAGTVSCSRSELSRAQAAAAISSRLAGPAGSVRVFRTRCVEKDFGKYPLVFYEDNRIARQHRALEETGLATRLSRQPTAEECGTPYLEHKEMIAIALTRKGESEKWPEHNERGGGWDVVVARRELMEVTRIVTESDPTMARAEFTWRLEPTAGGEALGQDPSPMQQYATFQRFDDGWRLVNNRARQVEPTGRAPAPFNSPRLD